VQLLNRVLPGQIEIIGGVKCYVGTPTIDYPKDKVVLFLLDAFGLGLINNKVSISRTWKFGFVSCDVS
jgi:hypothetical protein